jgi:23S rRNA (uracil1939-C5)-methyltransferase
MAERLVINRLGSRGDGVADTDAGTIYVPYALPGEAAEVEPWPGHANRRHLIKLDVASAERITPICPHFGFAAAARFSIWRLRAIAIGNALWSSPPSSELESTCPSMT